MSLEQWYYWYSICLIFILQLPSGNNFMTILIQSYALFPIFPVLNSILNLPWGAFAARTNLLMKLFRWIPKNNSLCFFFSFGYLWISSWNVQFCLFEHIWYCYLSFQSSTAIFYFQLGLLCSATGHPLGQWYCLEHNGSLYFQFAYSSEPWKLVFGFQINACAYSWSSN